MKFFFASHEGTAEIENDNLIDIIDYRLVSYYVMEQQPSYNEYFLDKFRSNYDALMLDSGAFSAWSQGIYIDHRDYVDYCLTEPFRDKYDYFVVLDRIPKNPRNEDESNECAIDSIANYEYMLNEFRKAGMDVAKIIPVYHQGENIRYLEALLDRGIPYIGLSPSNRSDYRTPQKREFLESCWNTCMHDGHPRAKFHAFGLSSMPLLREYKDMLYSADAKTWAQSASTGNILVPVKVNSSKDATFYEQWSFIHPEVIDIGSEAKRGGWFLQTDDEGEHKISLNDAVK